MFSLYNCNEIFSYSITVQGSIVCTAIVHIKEVTHGTRKQALK